MPQRILFVCLGNICRSPTAEAVTRHMARLRGISVELDSAGTGDWHAGEPPYAPMQAAARARGYDMSALRARRVTPEDFRRFDRLLAMDRKNHDFLVAQSPRDATARLEMFIDYARHTSADHIPDPYYTRDFNGTLRLIERAAAGLLDQLAE